MCGCKKSVKAQYVWTSADSQSTETYDSEIAAKAKVIRKGGTYVRKDL